VNIVIFLQNAWSPVYAGRKWPRQSWLRALSTSRSGQRLTALTDDFNECENTTEEVADHPDGICQPDPQHIGRVLKARKPKVVIACGKQAEKAISAAWSGPLIVVPHPACRVVTTAAYLKAQSLITESFIGRVAIRQKRGGLELIDL